MTERRHKKAVRSARKCENLLDRQRGGNKNGYKWRKSVRCRLCRGSSEGWEVLTNSVSLRVSVDVDCQRKPLILPRSTQVTHR